MLDASMFEDAVRDYLLGQRDWDMVHQLALQMEVDGVEFPPEVRRPFEELHFTFLTADSKDDPQFRADREEISDLLGQINRLRSAAKELGSDIVAKAENTLDMEQQETQRLKYLTKRQRRLQK